MLFSKQELGNGKLVLLDKPQWTGWRDSKVAAMRRKMAQTIANGDFFKAWVSTMGKKFSCGGHVGILTR